MRSFQRIAVLAVSTALATAAITAPASAEPSQVFYIAPHVTVTEANTDGCRGATQYFNARDYQNVEINWTNATNEDHPCLRVDYYPVTTSRFCNFYFYVPSNYATARMEWQLESQTGERLVNLVFDENPYSGFTWLASSGHVPGDAPVSHIWFTDGTAWPSGRIGWGVDAGHGIMQVCDA
ncbi:hypothetical protein [Nonomuraea sp. NPDC003754]